MPPVVVPQFISETPLAAAASRDRKPEETVREVPIIMPQSMSDMPAADRPTPAEPPRATGAETAPANGLFSQAPESSTPSTAPKASLRWVAWRQSGELAALAVCHPTPRQLEIAYWVACLLPFAAVFCAAPALPHLRFAGEPVWAQALLCLASLHLGYAIWLATVPDHSALRVGYCLFGASALAFLLAAAWLALSPTSIVTGAGLADMRATGAAWCILSATVTGLVAAACRWIADQWRSGRL